MEFSNNIHIYDKVVDFKRLSFIERCISEHKLKNSKVLDVGCGNGNISISLGKEGFIVYGIDLSEAAINKAKQLNPFNNVTFEVKDAEELIIKGNKFKVIICSEVIEHLHKPIDLLNKLYNLLDDDGILILTTPNGFGPRELFITRPIQWIKYNFKGVWIIISKIKKLLGYTGTTKQSDASDLDHIQFFSLYKLMKTTRSTGFKILNVENSDFLENVFPFSLFTRHSNFLQKVDCKLADILPHNICSGFHILIKKV